MIKRITIFLIFCLASLVALPQSSAITNIQVLQRTDGSGFVDVFFNLIGAGNTMQAGIDGGGAGIYYTITLQASFDGGSTYSSVPPAFLSGDISDLSPGNNKHIIWDGLGSFPATYSTQAKLKLIANESIGNGTPCPGMPTFTDPRDGQIYNTVQIGDQCWMKENLKYLPSVVGPGAGSNTVPYYYVYDYNGTSIGAAKATANYQNYGTLYNWPASLTACPIGWHIPSTAEWSQLTNYVAAQGFPNSNVINGAGNALKSCRQVNSPLGGACNTSEHPRWDSHNTHHGFDEFGFAAFPGGSRHAYGYFIYLGWIGRWWRFDEGSSTHAWYRSIVYFNGDQAWGDGNGGYGYSVRCLRD